jgi:threonine/homoserine/homoserine lactone efflux protein
MNDALMPLVAVGLGATVSFIATLPPGVISITVMDIAGRKSIRDGLVVAASAAFIEFFQAVAAVSFSSVITKSPVMQEVIKYGAIPLFILFGLYTFFKKSPQHLQLEQPRPASTAKNVVTGLLIGATNLLVIPFWIGWSAWCASNGWIDYELGSVLGFSAGATTGTFLALAIYAKLGGLMASRAARLDYWIKKILGVVFISIGVYQLVRVLMEKSGER